MQILVQLARTEHAAANAEKDPYGVEVVFKCMSIQSNFLTARDASLPDPVRVLAMANIVGTLNALKLLWVYLYVCRRLQAGRPDRRRPCSAVTCPLRLPRRRARRLNEQFRTNSLLPAGCSRPAGMRRRSRC